jgi:hypothetical protein
MIDRDGLRQFQRRFAASLLTPLDVGDAAIAPPGHEVHRRNVLASLANAIETTFSVTRALVGAECFAAMAARFVTAYPPTRGWLCAYGARFPAFVKRYGPAAAVPCLPDVARLEWSRVRAASLPDGPGLDLRMLSAQPADVLTALALPLHPAAQLLYVRFPVLDIWSAHQSPQSDDHLQRVNANGPGGVILVTRSGRIETSLTLLCAGDAAFLCALRRHLTFGEAWQAALRKDAHYDLGQQLIDLVRVRALGCPVHRASQKRTSTGFAGTT